LDQVTSSRNACDSILDSGSNLSAAFGGKSIHQIADP
jgi:hypothetical protein